MDSEPDPEIIDFWIIDTKASKRFGPLTSEGFRETREEIGVPSDLLLKDVYSFRPNS